MHHHRLDRAACRILTDVGRPRSLHELVEVQRELLTDLPYLEDWQWLVDQTGFAQRRPLGPADLLDATGVHRAILDHLPRARVAIATAPPWQEMARAWLAGVTAMVATRRIALKLVDDLASAHAWLRRRAGRDSEPFRTVRS